MKKRQRRRFTAAVKELAVKRMAKGESVSSLAREYGVERSRLYQWKDRWETGLPFSESGRPETRAYPSTAHATELEAASARIAELERKVGRQQMLIDFLQGALRQVAPTRPGSNVAGVSASSGTSKE
jgi:transposase-like protein